MKNLGTFKNLIIVLFIAAVFFLVRLGSFNAYFTSDEGTYSYVAFAMSEGLVPYLDVFDYKPPLIFYTYFVSYLLAPDARWLPRLFAAAFLLTTSVLTAVIAKKEFDPHAGFIALLITPLMFSFPWLSPYAADTEVFMIMFLVAALFIYFWYKEEAAWIHWLLFGVFSSLSLLYKPLGLAILSYIFATWLFRSYFKRGLKYCLINSFFALIGFALTSLVVLWPIIHFDAGYSFVENVLLSTKYYILADFSLPRFLTFAALFLFSMPLIFVFSSVALFKTPKKSFFYLNILILALVTLIFSVAEHYFILIIPFLALTTAMGVGYLTSKPYSRILSKILVFTILASLFFQKIYFNRSVFVSDADRRYAQLSPKIAEKISEATAPGDFVYIAGFDPQILFYSRRIHASRFIDIGSHMFKNAEKRNEYKNEVLNDIQATKPAVVVLSPFVRNRSKTDSVQMEFFSIINKILAEDYHFLGGLAWANDPAWATSLAELKNTGAYLVYKRND